MTKLRSKIILHIGGQKCGSSALQGYLFFGRFELAKRGVHYLDPKLGTELRAAKSHSKLMPQLTKGGANWVRKRLAKLEWHDPTVTYAISSEGFCSMASIEDLSAALAPMSDFGNVHVVLYVRPQSEVIYSGWQQWGLNLEFDEWVNVALKRDFANWNLILNEWRRALPDAQFSVRAFARDLFPNSDIISDFTEVTNIPRVTPRKKGQANPTFDDLTALALRALACTNDIDPKRLMVAMKKAGLELSRNPRNLVLSDDHRRQINSHYEKGNKAFLETSGMDEGMINRFLESRVPSIDSYSEHELQMQRKYLAEAITSSSELEAYSGIRA